MENFIYLIKDDIDLFIDNYIDIELWKLKFLVGSWILKGFGIVFLFDVIIENVILNLKSNLLKLEDIIILIEIIEFIFIFLFKISGLKFGFIIYNFEEEKFNRLVKFDIEMNSFLFLDDYEVDCKNVLFGCFFENLLDKKEVFVIFNVEKFF